ncbi:MAG: hypothetical protein ACRCZF_24965, partial [Gemmataceae bacterium]
MADIRHRKTIGNRLRFLLRFLGLTGLVAALAGGGFLAATTTLPTDLPGVERLWQTTLAAPAGSPGQIAGFALAAGLAAVALWLLWELLSGLFLVTGRRTVVNLNSSLQLMLALVLFVSVNGYSFRHYRRFDTTREKLFTLPESVLEKLKTLDPSRPTDVVVLQLHKTAGALSDKPDALDGAAERKVVEKVKDLVEQLRELGPRFQVTVLDRTGETYEDQLDELTRNSSELREAIEAAPENSIFFHSGRRVSRMGFGEFYLLDKPASLGTVTTKSGKERRRPQNLVLNPQGVEVFASRLVSLEEKKPKVGLLVVHPLLASQEDVEEYTLRGLRKSLEANGFEVTDVILKKWPPRSPKPSPGVEVYAEYELSRVEAEYGRAELLVADRSMALSMNKEARSQAEKADLKTVDRLFRRYVGRAIETEADRTAILKLIDTSNTMLQQELDEFTKARTEASAKFEKVFANESAVDARRSTDISGKLTRMVQDCDLLIIPRMTVQDLGRRRTLPPALYNLSTEQADVVKSFLTAGKPVLGLFGPTEYGGRDVAAQVDPEKDALAPLFNRLGIEFGKQAILFDKEAEALGDDSGEEFGTGGPIVLP